MNIFGLCVFRRIKNQHSFHKLIICLTIVDTCVLLLSIVDGVYRGLVVRSEFLTQIYPYFVHPCFYMCVCCSIYITICISHERYSALKDPVRYSNISMQQTKKWKFLKYFLATLIFSIIYNIIRFSDFQTVCLDDDSDYQFIKKYNITILDSDTVLRSTPGACNDPREDTKMTILDRNILFNNETSNGIFRTVIATTDCLVLGLVPFVLLIFFNASIYGFVRKQRQKIGPRINMSIENQQVEDRIRINEIRMAVSFITIVAVFFICHSVWLVSSVIGAIFDWKALNKTCHTNEQTKGFCEEIISPWYIKLTYASRLLMVINSAVNILLYGVVWNQFREEARDMLMEIFICLGITKHPRKHKSYFSNTEGTASTEMPLTKIC